MQPTIVITGGAGYIGSNTAFLMAQQGYKVIIIDKLIHQQPFNHAWATLIQQDFADQGLLDEIFTKNNVEAVMHFAAFIEVGESVTNPSKFYDNNVVKTLQLLESMLKHGVKKFIFSSSCAVYGDPQFLPLTEEHPKTPVSPYGKTKLAVEMILEDFNEAYGLESVALRYFNAAGAFPEQQLGEQHVPESHLIPLLLRAAQHDKPFKIFGTDYATKDGTCVRDFLHVRDIADAHVRALEHLNKQHPSDCFNLGTGHGFSVKEMIESVERICGKKINTILAKRRPGDPATLVADPSKAMNILRWKPHYSDLDFIIKTAYTFEQQ